MLWVLKKTVSVRWFFSAPKTYAKNYLTVRKYLQFYAEIFCLSKPVNIYFIYRYNGRAVIYFPHKTSQQQPSLRPGYQYMPGREKLTKNISGVLSRYVIPAKNLFLNQASR